MIRYRTKTGIGIKPAVLPPAVSASMIKKSIVVYLAGFSAYCIVGVKQVVASGCLLRFQLERFIDVASVAQNVIDQSTKLRGRIVKSLVLVLFQYVELPGVEDYNKLQDNQKDRRAMS